MNAPLLFLGGRVALHPGDCLAVLRTMADNSLDSCVCDPPYHLTSIVKRFGAGNAAPAKVGQTGVYARSSRGFMGKTWDGGDIAFQPELWAEVLRVLKPGGYLVAFSGTRTYHRMACAIEDGGFDIRDQLAWVYGSGFPKSHDVSKGIDKAGGHKRATEYEPNFGNNTFGKGMGGGKHGASSDPAVTDAARQWQGWGTALKPAWEPICLARKPIEGTNVENVLRWGTGALNVDGCRVVTADDLNGGTYARATSVSGKSGSLGGGPLKNAAGVFVQPTGRWPANLVHDGSDEVLAAFPQTKGSANGGSAERNSQASEEYWGEGGGGFKQGRSTIGHGDSGSAARFFYTSKAGENDRIYSRVEEVKLQWISASGPCQVKLQADTELSLEKAIVVSASTDGNGWNTFLSGSTIEALFQTASKFIIATKTSSTTTSRIWSFLTRLLTNACIAGASCETVSGGSRAESAESGAQSITIILGKMASLPGASHALSGTPFTISVCERLHSHPTCKPVDLMRWLVRLVTPPKGTCLDPFAGTGTTGEAAWREGMNAVLIEREPEYQADIARRMTLCLAGSEERARAIIKAKHGDVPAGGMFASLDAAE